MNDAPVLVNEKFHVTSKWPFSERHYKMEYKPLSEEGEQIDARDVAHVHTKRSSRGKRFGGLSPRSWSKSQLAVLGFVIAAAVQSKLQQGRITVNSGRGGSDMNKLIGGGCGRGMCPLPREARKRLTDRHPAHN